MADHREVGWLPDYFYRDGRFESGIALFADSEGRITRFSNDAADLAKARRLQGRAVLPGLINAHSHAFQRVIRGRTEYRTSATRDTFWTWREAMYHAALQLSPKDIYCSASMAFLEMALSGITSVGEFHYLHHASDGTPYADRNLLAKQVLRAAADVGIRIALLRTAYVRGGWQKEVVPCQMRFITPQIDDFIADTEALEASVGHSDHAWVGVAPHSIRAVPQDYLLRVVKYARARGLPIHMHAAEQPAEIQACLAEYGARPIEFLDHDGILGSDFTAVHAIHINEEEIVCLSKSGARVCACPTTERNLGDGIVAASQLQSARVPICLGSDSNIQIDLLEDARELEYHLRLTKQERAIFPSTFLFQTATECGAASICAPGGSLEAGRPADFFTVDLNDPSISGAHSDSLLSHILFSLERSAIREVIVGGQPIIEQCRHTEQEQIVTQFAHLQQRLWGAPK